MCSLCAVSESFQLELELVREGFFLLLVSQSFQFSGKWNQEKMFSSFKVHRLLSFSKRLEVNFRAQQAPSPEQQSSYDSML